MEFTDDALQLISDYAKRTEDEIRNLPINLKPEYLNTVIFNVKHHVGFYSVKNAMKRGSTKVEVIDVKSALKSFGEPEKFVKSRFRSVKACLTSQRNFLDGLETMKGGLKNVETPMVLDAGCGWGRLSKLLKDHCAKSADVVGVDVDKLSLQYGRFVNRDATFIHAVIEKLPLKDQVFDAVMAGWVLHEVKSAKGREKAVKEFCRVLKPKGMLYIGEAFAKLRIISAITFILQHLTRKVEWIPKREDIEKSLEESGFKIVSIKKDRSHLRGLFISHTLIAEKSKE